MSTSPSKKRGPYAPSLARRAKIAQTVLDIVDESGPESVTTNQVAKQAGIPEPSVLYHFPTKDHLYVAALELADQELETYVRSEIDLASMRWEVFVQSQGSGPYSTPGRHRLNALVSAHSSTPGHPAKEYVGKRLLRALELWTALIESRQRKGLVNPDLDPHQTAAQVLGLLAGLDIIRHSIPDLDSTDLAIKGIERILTTSK